MSDTNRVGLRFFKSSQREAPIPGGPFDLQQLRFTGTPNLAFVPNTIVSNEIRPDRQISDLILVGAEAGGDTGIELSYGAFNPLIEGALFNTYTSTVRKQGTSEITGFGAGTVDVDNGGDLQSLTSITINPRGKIVVGTDRVLTAQALSNAGVLTGDGQVDAPLTN